MISIEGLILGTIFTGITVFICLICLVIICLVRCSLLQTGYEFCPSRRVSSRYHNRDIENQPEQDDEEVNRARDLSQAPPPAYRNINQYQNVDLEHTEVVRLEETHRISTHIMKPETASLPPDYTPQTPSISVAPQEVQAPEGQLPPTYSTAQLELMARSSRAMMEQDTPREWTSISQANRERHESEFHFHLPSDSQA
jgi:hypothetical protein